MTTSLRDRCLDRLHGVGLTHVTRRELDHSCAHDSATDQLTTQLTVTLAMLNRDRPFHSDR